MIELNKAGINAELKSSHRWVRWALCDVQDGPKLRKEMKPPYQVNGHAAKHNDPKTWNSHDAVVAAHEASVELKHPATVVKDHGVRGIGVVIGPPFFGIDLDDCRNAETGELTPEASEWVAELQTFCEVSPSGTGLHFWGHGEPPYKEGHRKDGREIYSTNRYLTVTGVTIGATTEIRRFTPAEVKALYERVKNGTPKFVPLSAPRADMMSRVDFPDLSQAVMSLLTGLAYDLNCDAEKIEAEFLKSQLYLNTHWSTKWTRLREAHLAKAIQFVKDNPRRVSTPEKRELVTPDACMTRRAPLRWNWKPVLLQGAMLNLSGESSQGKSPLVIDIMARMSRLPGHDGFGEWPDGQKMRTAPLHSILLNSEDNLEDTILPRFDAADGCSMFFHPVTGVKVSKEDSFHQRMLGLKEDINLICDLARKLAPNLGIIGFDPITNYLGRGLRMNQEEEVRSVLMPLVTLMHEVQANAIIVSHLNKSDSQDPMLKVMGARAFVGVARTAWQCSSDPDQPENPYAHIMSPIRGEKGAGSFKYHTVVENVEIDHEPSEVVRIVWDGKSNATASQALNPDLHKDAGLIEKAAPVLRDYLKAGKRNARECLAFMREGGYDIEKCSLKVRKAAGVESSQKDRQWWWFLPSAQHEFQIPLARKDDGAPTF
jgi:hypothetical protein